MNKMRIKRILIGMVAIILLVGAIKYYNRPNNGIYHVDENVCVIEGECVILNWDTSEEDVELALELWRLLKEKEKE